MRGGVVVELNLLNIRQLCFFVFVIRAKRSTFLGE